MKIALIVAAAAAGLSLVPVLGQAQNIGDTIQVNVPTNNSTTVTMGNAIPSGYYLCNITPSKDANLAISSNGYGVINDHPSSSLLFAVPSVGLTFNLMASNSSNYAGSTGFTVSSSTGGSATVYCSPNVTACGNGQLPPTCSASSTK
ncbi:MAG: hypothetical protein A3F67_09815 [Verrucomicrobia bacterium RIFCSPHIGHO2_12_FULL_41_10]|nr:MAG: hypothetical protein A3F67_09815 [Verrucomicrobia bacterium RIFCSPHIGHO2_12_FULL_41_10]